MDSPVVIAPGSYGNFLVSQVSASAPGLTQTLNTIISATFDEYPNGQIVGYDVAGAGDGSYLATMTVSAAGDVVDPTAAIGLDGAFAFALDAGPASQDERTADRYLNAGGLIPPVVGQDWLPTATLYQTVLMEFLTALIGNQQFEAAFYGLRPAGRSDRRFVLLGMMSVELVGFAAAEVTEILVRVDAGKLADNPLAAPFAQRLRAIRSLPKDTRAALAKRNARPAKAPPAG